MADASRGISEDHPWNYVIDAPDVAGRLGSDIDPDPDVHFAPLFKRRWRFANI